MIQFKSTKKVNYPLEVAPGKKRIFNDFVVLTVTGIFPKGNKNEGICLFEICSRWNDINGNQIIVPRTPPLDRVNLEQLEAAHLPALSGQNISALLEQRIKELVPFILDRDHQQDTESNFGLTGSDVTLVQNE